MTAFIENLISKHGRSCRDLTTWWKTGILPEGPLRDRANDPTAPWSKENRGDPSFAERELIRQIVIAIAEAHEQENPS